MGIAETSLTVKLLGLIRKCICMDSRVKCILVMSFVGFPCMIVWNLYI